MLGVACVGKRGGKKSGRGVENGKGKRKRGREREESRDSCNEGVKIVVTSSLTLYHVASPKMQPR